MTSSVSDVLSNARPEEVQGAYERVLKGHSSGITKTLEWRLHQLKQLAYLLQENEAQFEETLAIDLGRSKEESHVAELNGIRNEVLHALKQVKNWIKPQHPKTETTWLIARPKIYHEPKGVVLIFGTWNYPVSIVIGPLVGAIAGGNSAIVKPSENCPRTSSLITKLIGSYLDPNNIQAIYGEKRGFSITRIEV